MLSRYRGIDLQENRCQKVLFGFVKHSYTNTRVLNLQAESIMEMENPSRYGFSACHHGMVKELKNTSFNSSSLVSDDYGDALCGLHSLMK